MHTGLRLQIMASCEEMPDITALRLMYKTSLNFIT